MSIQISPSQIATYRLCPRRWGWRYIDSLEAPQTAAAALGEAVHAKLEAYYRDGVAPSDDEAIEVSGHLYWPGKIAAAMIRAEIPLGGKCEEWIMRSFGGVNMIGRADYIHENDERVLVVDHKTSANPLKYGYDEESAATCPQSVVYAWILSYYVQKPVAVAYNYADRKASPPSLRWVQTSAEPPEVWEERFHRLIAPTVREIKSALFAQSATQLPYNSDACAMYGGCPYRNKCRLTAGEIIGGLIMGHDLIDDLLATDANEKTTETTTTNDDNADQAPPANHENQQTNSQKEAAADGVRLPCSVSQPAHGAPTGRRLVRLVRLLARAEAASDVDLSEVYDALLGEAEAEEITGEN